MSASSSTSSGQPVHAGQNISCYAPFWRSIIKIKFAQLNLQSFADMVMFQKLMRRQNEMIHLSTLRGRELLQRIQPF